MLTCMKHADAAVVYPSTTRLDLKGFLVEAPCPVCSAIARLDKKLREAENTETTCCCDNVFWSDIAIKERGQMRLKVVEMQQVIDELERKLREAEDDIARPHVDSHCQCSKCVLLQRWLKVNSG